MPSRLPAFVRLRSVMIVSKTTSRLRSNLVGQLHSLYAHRLFAEFSLPLDAQSNSNFRFRLGTRYIKVCKTITNCFTTAPDGTLGKCGLLNKILCNVRFVTVRNRSSQKYAIASGRCAADCFFRSLKSRPGTARAIDSSSYSQMTANDPFRDKKRASRREPGPPPPKHR